VKGPLLLITAALFSAVIFSCRPRGRELPAGPAYAEGFSVSDSADVRVVRVNRPYPGGMPAVYYLKHGASGDTLPLPVPSYAATSVTYLEMLDSLGVLDRMKGFTRMDLIADPDLADTLKRLGVKELGSDMQPDMERLVRLRPRVIFVFSTGDDRKDFSALPRYGITPVYVAEWLETHPLGRAEWIKFFGAFFDRNRRANEVFEQIERAYRTERSRALRRTGPKPKVFYGGVYGDKWYVPGPESWAAKLVKDAGGEYLVHTGGTGSAILSHEEALMLLAQADVWLNPGQWQSREQILQALPALADMPAVKKGRIYSAYIKPNRGGKNDFFEKSVLHPHEVLRDLRLIFADSLDDGRFYLRLP